jgi:hypothetical protein
VRASLVIGWPNNKLEETGGYMIETRFRSYDELLFNIEQYHGTPITNYIRNWAQEHGNQPITIEYLAASKPIAASGICDLPVFRDTTNGKLICGHICIID